MSLCTVKFYKPGMTALERKSLRWTMDRGSWHFTGHREQDHPQEKEIQNSKMAVWGGLTNSCEKRSKNERYTHLKAEF